MSLPRVGSKADRVAIDAGCHRVMQSKKFMGWKIKEVGRPRGRVCRLLRTHAEAHRFPVHTTVCTPRHRPPNQI
jgi:hypothetical protein